MSNSTNPGEEYLQYPREEIRKFIGEKVKKILFIPYAAIRFSYDEYEERVNRSLSGIGCEVKGIHHFEDSSAAVSNAEAIMVGGGNTWKLVRMLHERGLVEEIRKRVLEGIPYIGWSAGSNVACPTMMTTNDMPVVDPLDFHTFNLVPFQINPHYRDEKQGLHGGETREDRILEFIEVNREVSVVGLRESTLLKVEDGEIRLIGPYTARLFKYGQKVCELSSSDDLSFLLKKEI